MSNRPIGFATPDDFRKMAKAVFRTESMAQSRGLQLVPDAVPVTAETHVIVDSGPDGNGFYTGRFTYRDMDETSPGSKWYTTDGCLIEEINGKSLEAGRRYEGRVYDVQEAFPDLPVVEVDSSNNAGGGGGGSTSADCSRLVTLDDRTCLVASVFSTTGDCANCIDETQTVGLYPQGGGVYLSIDDFVTCVGAGKLQFDKSNQCCLTLKVLGGVPPADGYTDPTDYTLWPAGCGVDESGNFFVEFAGGGLSFCNGTDVSDCTACPDGTFVTWQSFFDFTGLTTSCVSLAGAWSFIRYTAGSCVWEGTGGSGGGDATLTVAGGVGTVVFTASGLTYSGTWDCTKTNTLPRTAAGSCDGDGAPVSITLCPVVRSPGCNDARTKIRLTCGPCIITGSCCVTPQFEIPVTFTPVGGSDAACSTYLPAGLVLIYRGSDIWSAVVEVPDDAPGNYLGVFRPCASPHHYLVITQCVSDADSWTVNVYGEGGGDPFDPTPACGFAGGLIPAGSTPVLLWQATGANLCSTDEGGVSGTLAWNSLSGVPAASGCSWTLGSPRNCDTSLLTGRRHTVTRMAPASKPPCPFLGEPTGEKVDCPTCKGKVELKVFGCELHGKCVVGDKGTVEVRNCGGCGDNPANRDPWRHPVTVPKPPSLSSLRPDGRKALVTVVAGKRAEELFRISGPLMERYAKEHGADFLVSKWPGAKAWPMSAKFGISEYFKHYDVTVYADADVLFRPGCLDLFGATDGRSIAGFNDPSTRDSVHIEKEYQRFRAYMGLEYRPTAWYMNTGIMVVPRACAGVFTHPDRPLPPVHCGEQHWWIARMYDTNVPVKLLDDRYNYQWWVHHAAFNPPPEAVLHFSGMSDHAARVRLMREFAREPNR